MIHVTQKAVVQEIWLPSWRTKGKNCEKEYPAIISCLASPPNGSDSSTPSWVSFVDKNCVGSGTFVRIVSPPRKSPKNNFVVCVKPLHFTNVNEKTFHEWVEINHRLGAERIVVYLSDSTKTKSFSIRGKKAFVLADKRFEAPESKCPIKNFEDSVWYRRKLEIIAYNDCFYSNLRRTKFVVPLDVDEIIVPKTGNNWLEGFRSHFLNVTSPGQNENFWPENYASFSVRNAYFFSKYPKNAIVGGSELPKPYQNVPQKLVKTFPGIRKPSSKSKSIFDRTVRSFRLSPKSDSVKSFVSASKTLSVFNHFTFHVLGNAAQQYIFPQNAFQLNHYRNSCDPILIDGCQDFLNHVIYDDSLERFRNRKGKF